MLSKNNFEFRYKVIIFDKPQILNLNKINLMSYNIRENTQHSFVRELKQFQQIQIKEKLKTFNSNESGMDYNNHPQTNFHIQFATDNAQRQDQDDEQLINVQAYHKWLNQLQKYSYFTFRQLKQYQKLDKLKQNKIQGQGSQLQPNNYILFQVSSITNIFLSDFSNRLDKTRQPSIKVIFTLINSCSGHQYPKQIISPLLNLYEAEVSKNKSFFTNQKFSVFFHTSLKKVQLKIQIVLYEIYHLQNQTKVIIKEEILGGTIIQVLQNKESKMKKKKCITKIQFLYQNQNNNEKNTQISKQTTLGIINYNIINTPYIKLVSKLLPQNSIFWHEDLIPCLLGNHLPNNQDAGFQLNPSTQSFSVSLDIQNIQIPTNLISQAIQKFQNVIVKQFKSTQLKIYEKGLKIKLFFHNGLKMVQSITSNLIQKMQIQRKIKRKGGIKQDLINIKQYNANILFLPSAFLQQNCLLGIQIYLQTEVVFNKKSNINQQKKSKQQKQYLIPIVFTYFNCHGIASNKPVSRILLPGSFLKCQPNKFFNNIAKGQKLKTKRQSQRQLQAKNISQLQDSIIILRFQIKQGVFGEEWHSTKIQDKLMNQIFGQKSFLNNDSLKITNQKQKMVKVFNKKGLIKGKQQKNFVLKEQIAKIQTEIQQVQINVVNKKAKQIHLLTLKKKLQQLRNNKVNTRKYEVQNQIFQQFVFKQKAKSNTKQKENERLYKKIQTNISINYSFFTKKFPLSIKNMSLALKAESSYQNYHQMYQQTPIEILKTNLIESNIRYIIFINPVSIIPVISNFNKNYLLPNKFFIRIFFWNSQTYSPLLTIDPLAGQIKIVSSKKNQKHKVFNFQINPDSNFVNNQQYLMSFIDYAFNGMIQIQIIDQNTTVFGNSWFKLRNLVQKIKNQSVCTQQEQIFSPCNGVIGKLKIDLKYIKRQGKNNYRQIHQELKQESMSQLFKASLPQKIDKQNSQTLNKIQPSNQLQRINNFKNKIKERSNDLKSQMEKSKTNYFGQNKQTRQKYVNESIQAKYQDNIQKTIQRQYLLKQYQLKVTMLKKELFFIQLQNKFNQSGFFNIQISDEDLFLYQNTYPQQLIIIKNLKQLSKVQLSKFMLIRQNSQKILKHKQIKQNLQVFLQPYQKVSIICQYYSYRKYCPNNQEAFYNANHKHSIIVSLLLNKQVSSIVNIKIFPQPIKQVITIQQYAQEGKQYLIQLPFKGIELQLYDILIDNQKALIVTQKQNNSKKPSEENTLRSRNIQILSNKQSNLSTNKNRIDSIRQSQFRQSQSFPNQSNEQLVDAPAILFIQNQTSHKLKTVNVFLLPKQNKSQNGIANQENQTLQKSLAKSLNIFINIYAARQFAFKVRLFQTSSEKLCIQHKDIQVNEHIFTVVGIASQSQSLVFDKFWHKINQKQTDTIANFKIISSLYGKTSYQVNVINANKYNQLIQNQQGFSLPEAILSRYLITVITNFPQLKQVMTLNISQKSHQIIEQWFSYTNNYNQKTIFVVCTTHSSMISVSQKDSMIQINGKTQKKLKLTINTKNIVQRIKTKPNQIVILGFKCEKTIDYFGFKFNIK